MASTAIQIIEVPELQVPDSRFWFAFKNRELWNLELRDAEPVD
jgi:hypothetical protein